MAEKSDDGRKLRLDPDAASSSPSLPAFLARPEGAPVYHGFPIVAASEIDGWFYGAITDFEVGAAQTEGDGFVVAPDGSPAGIVWAVDSDDFSVILPPDAKRWGVYAVRFPRPVACVEDLVSNFRAVLPHLQRTFAALRGAP